MQISLGCFGNRVKGCGFLSPRLSCVAVVVSVVVALFSTVSGIPVTNKDFKVNSKGKTFIPTGKVELCFPPRKYEWNPYCFAVESKHSGVSEERLFEDESDIISKAEDVCDLLIDNKQESFSSRLIDSDFIFTLDPLDLSTERFADEKTLGVEDFYYHIDKDIQDKQRPVRLNVRSSMLNVERCQKALRSLDHLKQSILKKKENPIIKEKVSKRARSFVTCIRV